MAENQTNEDLVCDTCGRFGAVKIDDRRLCLDCYEMSGSCGAGGGTEETE